MTQITVHNRDRIGGNVTVISNTYHGETHRIIIDYGSALPGSEDDEEIDYDWGGEPVDAVFFTHYHGDHVGRLSEIPEHIPIYMGEPTRKILFNIQNSLGKSSYVEDPEKHQKTAALLDDYKRIRTFRWDTEARVYEPVTDIEGFKVEPYLVDHSAYDAYMFLITTKDEENETGEYVTLHTGDFRDHGYRGNKLLKMLRYHVLRENRRDKKPRLVDSLIIEGTMMSRLEEETLTEAELQRKARLYLKEHKYAFLICSSTNLDSLASFYQAAQNASSSCVRYMYTYSEYYRLQLEEFTNTAGQWVDLYRFENVFRLNQNPDQPLGNTSHTQRSLMERFGFLATIKPEADYEKYVDFLVEDYRNGKIDQMPVIIYSMWDGYIRKKNKNGTDNPARKDAWIEFLEKQEKKGVEIKHLHTSGHATPKAITDVINLINPKDKLIPMHTEHPDAFRKLAIRKEILDRIES